MIKKIKTLIVFELTVLMSLMVWVGFPFFRQIMSNYTYKYFYYEPVRLVEAQSESQITEESKGVPILMYHGIVSAEDEENTSKENFISHMESLKANGFETISLDQLDQFMDGKFKLPAKPIIISFDDGRKDSYYPVDDIIKKLGFRAAIFLATEKMNSKEQFYLDWEELKVMRDSGYWEIEAHGRDSHKRIIVDENGTEGRYLTSKMYLPAMGRIESKEEFEKRVEADFENGINDIYANLGINAKYYAVPLNDYGLRTTTNYPEATEFNQKMVEKYFRLAFVEGVVGRSRPGQPNVYNFQNTSRTHVQRIEPRNMSAQDLISLLESDYPRPAELEVIKDFSKLNKSYDYELRYGEDQNKSDGLHLLSHPPVKSAKAVLGHDYWENYEVEAIMKKIRGTSMSLIGYMADTDNYIALVASDKDLTLRQTVNGQTKDLKTMSSYINVSKVNKYRLVFDKKLVDVYLNDRLLFAKVPIEISRGRVGIKIWDEKEGEMVLQSIAVKSR